MRSTATKLMAPARQAMSCPDLTAIQAFLEGSADDGASEAIKAHLADCVDCRALVLGIAPQVEATLASSESEPGTEVAPGRTIGRYVVVRRLGAGGMGVVYAAHDPELDRKIALKLMRRNGDDAAAAKALQARLLREAHAMARVSHPNVITVYDVGAYADGVFIAMELVEGETLARWLLQPRPWREVLALFRLAGCGLEAAHQAGMVHRDFKPDNVLVGRDGRVRVTDFGLARLTDLTLEESRESANASPLKLSLTHSGTLMGTPAYMAPEQLSGQPADVRSDVFSFCVALFEALYRQRPFIGTTLQELRDAINANCAPTPPQRGVPSRVRRVLLRGLRAAPSERYATMGALLAALDPAARAQGPRALAVAATLALAVGGVGVVASTLLRSGVARLAAAPAVAAVAPSPLVAAPAPSPPPATATPTASPPPVMAAPAIATAAPGPATASPAPARGTLIVRANSDRARFELDGKVIAEAAQTAHISTDADRDHRLRVTAPGFAAYETRVRVGAGATVDKRVMLTPRERARPAAAAAPPASANSAAAPDPDDALDPYSAPR
jgi:hypothetical protein